jgi:hypothetical protein
LRWINPEFYRTPGKRVQPARNPFKNALLDPGNAVFEPGMQGSSPGTGSDEPAA